jgi:hypothetical protein
MITNRKIKIIAIVLVVLFLINYGLGKVFKVNYSSDNFVFIDSIKINDSIMIKNCYVVLGKNYKGFIEGVFFPASEQRYNNRGIVEYYYLRFHPEWYEKNINPHIVKDFDSGYKLAYGLIGKAKIAHNNDFQNCCHFNDYPLVNEKILFLRISMVGIADKVTVFDDI